MYDWFNHGIKIDDDKLGKSAQEFMKFKIFNLFDSTQDLLNTEGTFDHRNFTREQEMQFSFTDILETDDDTLNDKVFVMITA